MKSIKLDEFKKYVFLSGLQISDDGNFAAYVAAHMDMEENGYKKALYLLDLQTKKTKQLTGEDVESFFGFDGERLLFSARRSTHEKDESEKTFVYALPLCGGEALPAYCFPYPVLKLKMVDKKTALVLHSWKSDPFATLSKEKAEAAKKEEKDYEVFEEIPFWKNGGGFTSRKRDRLYVYNLSTMKSVALTDEFTQVNSFDFDKKSGDILFTKVTYTDKMPIYDELMLMNIKTKKAKRLHAAVDFMYSDARFLNDAIIYTGADGKKYGINQDADIYCMSKTGNDSKRISPANYDKSLWNSVGSDCRLGSGINTFCENGMYYFITTEDDSSYLNVIDSDGGIRKLTNKKGSVDCFAIKNDTILFIGLREQELQEVYLLNKDGMEECLTNHNAYAQKLTKIKPEEFTFENDGVQLHGFVLKPIDYKSGKKYPGILAIHGGPKTVYGSVFYHEMQFLAQQGYFVFYTNPRGSDGMGRAFADIRGKYGTVDYDDLMKMCDETLKRYKSIDKTRLGVMGGSYGGFMTNWIIGHTDRFAAACSQRSISNWVSKFGITDIGYYFNSDQQGGATPWKNQEKLWEHSPLKYADKCKTPTLFIQGDEDYRCFEACAFQMFTGLKYHGCEAKLVLFHGENHELSRSGKPKHRVRRLTEIFNWFEKYLKK
ncbi:S9 family peptidase [Treponema phagedenis]|uniref:S9 family peptidase n=1 Tax=Treponema phagedenis TaxID=162 RepID=A0A0B7GYS1_TREPH|nr:S9 family peptidase [Treponema phagedenis]NVP22858.1 S9 family peptidase [Treponema phagedenis]QEJ94933.1 S9 family peptidase [Treponema phagedenis]QEJ98339.1 S9 family peptidase [Treponema phagedenis]QEK00834.1 S9 family peptidase [Treponema phagedenis]QEK03849.1 S9 family peptidase [Treponema phagedenis]